MKKVIICFAILMLGLTLKGQAPSGFTYQALLRDAAGTVKANTLVAVKFEILQGSSTGTVAYSETHSTTTTSTGLINLTLGSGTPVTGTFAGINWSTGSYFLKITVDNIVLGTSQLLSVPYAIFSTKAGNGFSGNYNDLTNKPDLTVGAVKKMTVTSETTNMEEALFEVKNKAGQTVFAVYNEGVRVYVGDGNAKGTKGGFAIGGFAGAKAPGQDYLVVNPDSIRLYVENAAPKGSKGGFAIGSFSPGKALPQNLLLVNSDSIRAFIDTNTGKGAKGGFAIGGFSPGKGTDEEYLRVTRDSTRVFINNSVAKGTKGGFAIGGFANSKGVSTDYFLISPDSTNFYVRSNGSGSSSTFNILSLDANLNQKPLMRANSDTIDMKSVLTLENNFNVFGSIGYTGAVDKILAPDITTTAPSAVTESAAKSGGTIVSNGGAAIITSGIVWSTSTNPTTALPTKTTDGTLTGTFTSNITGLAASTTYYVRAYATNSVGTSYGSELMFVTLGAGGTVADTEGNIYNTVIIGTQTWMAQNLKTTHFADGSTIPNVKDAMGWQYLSTAAYVWYNNDSLAYHNSGYGALYNWFAVNSGKLCPTGWHVPSVAEFTTLSTFLGGNMTAGSNLKEAGNTHWNAPNTDATNSSGFTALPGGLRVYMGPFMSMGVNGSFWSSSSISASDALYASMNNNVGDLSVGPGFVQIGISVRCLQGVALATVPTVTTNPVTPAYTDANGGGEVINEGGAAVTARGVCWSQTPMPTIAASRTNDGTGSGFFASYIAGLQPGTTYYVRAYATNSVGTSYGAQEVFTTIMAK
jgi:uncharacterized protein (TIGR02145 family)